MILYSIYFKGGTMRTFKEWYMELYYNFDNIFLISAKLLSITYHEFVLISLVIVWPLITFVLIGLVFYLLGKLKGIQSVRLDQD